MRRYARIRFATIRKLAHWAVVLLCIAQIPTSWAIHRTHAVGPFGRPDPFDLFLHKLHSWSGWIVLALACAGLTARLLRPGPHARSLFAGLIVWGGHLALYGLLIALALTGTVTSYISGAAGPVHVLLTKLLLVTALMHAGVALFHHFILRDDVLQSMLSQHKPRRGRT